jgi:antitoxin component of RelBE/YafQ-DinJ toxin-antitoxin module
MASPRNEWLRLPDEGLLQQCRQERYKASGPGGQRRNKVQTANKLHHPLSGITVQAQESRSLRENQTRAIHRLRERIAIEVRLPFDLASPELPSELIAQRGAGGKLAINRRNRAYLIVLATALDALKAADGRYANAAQALGITTSQLMRFLQDDPEVVRWLAEQSQRAG